MGGESSKFSMRCPASDPANPHILSHGVDRKVRNPSSSGCFNCSKPNIQLRYSCITCNVEFHDECYKYPKQRRHPYHSQHPLTLTVRDDETKTGISKPENSKFLFNTCDWCGGDLGNKFYCCSICGFCLDLSCVGKSPQPTIENPKSHHHPLEIFPRPFPLPCDACGLVQTSEPTYTCFQCNYMVHCSCTNLPRVIKITRHLHRLAYIPFSPKGNSTCQICYKRVDIKYGHYSCYQEGCSYTAHSLCATDENVWDKNELEWEPEEADEVEDIEPFKTVGVDLIKYFCHEHHLRLQKYDVARDAGKKCEACILHIGFHDFYHCIECDFYLHEVCANLPRKLDHALHLHPLSLISSPSHKRQECSSCARYFSGFRYECSKINNQKCNNFQVDIQCILVPDYFTHKSHEHPLFISTCSTSKDDIFCKGCESMICGKSHLQCTLCTFALCYPCTTIPDEIYYKHDKHPLSLCYGEEVDGTYWCEICEKEIDSTKWFYTCTKCCVTIHRRCIFGSSVYMKPGYTFRKSTQTSKVVSNSRNNRPICIWCGEYCPYSIYYKVHTMFFCSVECMCMGSP